jgi:predicted SAM-dependent methyltransferase
MSRARQNRCGHEEPWRIIGRRGKPIGEVMHENLKRSLKRIRLLVAAVRVGRYAWRSFAFEIRRLALLPRRSRAIRSYLAANGTPRLQIGSGDNVLAGWLNTDLHPKRPEVAFLDATERFPVGDATFEYVFSEHQIEHIDHEQGRHLLRECFRVLRPGGRLRVATPDLDRLLRLAASPRSAIQERYIRWITDEFIRDDSEYRHTSVINNAFRAWGHQFLYDAETLRLDMEVAGFVDVTRFAPGESAVEVLCGVDSHGHAISDEELNRFETMVLEGTRPA